MAKMRLEKVDQATGGTGKGVTQTEAERLGGTVGCETERHVVYGTC